MESKTSVKTRLSTRECEKVRDECDKMLQNDVIEPSNSDWRSAVVLMPKPDGSIQFCVNYKQLNKHRKFDPYPLPNPHFLLDKLNGSKCFISLDLKSGYWQICDTIWA
eukprot:NODE_42_length_34079_cov_0.552619.p25 type:complete len:108 gc:universal NODE_42_length_34079_cov_0.552619:24925-25248(+)